MSCQWKGVDVIKLTTKEFAIMKCLWEQSIELSSSDLQQALGLKYKTINITLKNLENKNLVQIIGLRRNTEITNRKPMQLYAPTITNTTYMESFIISNPIYNNDLLPSLFQGLIGRGVGKETLQKISDIVEQARRELE